MTNITLIAMPTNRSFKCFDMNAATKERDGLNLEVHHPLACTSAKRDRKFPYIIVEATIVCIVSIAVIPATQDGEAVKEAHNHEAWQRAVIRLIIRHIIWRWDRQAGEDKSKQHYTDKKEEKHPQERTNNNPGGRCSSHFRRGKSISMDVNFGEGHKNITLELG